MGKPGWIYLKRDVNTDGTARGYKFGLTTSKKNRYRTYKTENPSIELVDDFETEDVVEAERDLQHRVAFNGMTLYRNSSEWVHPDTYERFKGVWSRVKEKHQCGSEYIAREKQKELDRIERKRQEEEQTERFYEEQRQQRIADEKAYLARQEEIASQPVFVEQTKSGMPADLFIGLGVVLALPALAMLYYVFVAFYYAVKGIAAFWFQFGIPLAILAVGVGTCVFIYRYGMKAAAECGEI
jgi:hypothetical protein